MESLIEVLKALGFVDSGRGLWQRKTDHTNLIVALREDTATIWHGAANINREYAAITAPTIFRLELEICRATFSQLLEQMSHDA